MAKIFVVDSQGQHEPFSWRKVYQSALRVGAPKPLAKQIADVGWRMFIDMLSYKCDWYGKELVKIGTFYPSSKTCSNCGCINQDLKLSDREWTCKSCGSVLDRDLNAAINILHEGLKISTAGIAVNADGGPYQSSTKKKAPVKSETQLVGCATIK